MVVQCCIQHKLEPNNKTLNQYVMNGLSWSTGLDNHKNLVKSMSRSSSLTRRKAFSMSVDKAYWWRRKRRSISHASTKGVAPTRRQSLRLACLGDWRQLQLYTILTGVVEDFLYTG